MSLVLLLCFQVGTVNGHIFRLDEVKRASARISMRALNTTTLKSPARFNSFPAAVNNWRPVAGIGRQGEPPSRLFAVLQLLPVARSDGDPFNG